jgi:glucose-6-phosphate isomerase
VERAFAERCFGSQLITLAGKLLEKYNPASPCAQELNAITVRLAKKDAALWGSGAENEAKTRLNWIDLPATSRNLLPQLDALSAYARSKDLTKVILCGMGGSSLAPEVMAKTYGKHLTVLDTTDPDQILAGIPQSLANTVVVVGSKSGSTIETASHLALFTKLFQEADLVPKDHLVIITDPNSPLDKSARETGLRVINADPYVGGRYSALSAFGLTPAALLGIDISVLLDDADAARKTFEDSNSTVVKMATLLFEQVEQCFGFCDTESQVPGISDRIEQLIAESTGKDGKGRLPVVIDSVNAKSPRSLPLVGFDIANLDNFEIVVKGTLGEQFIFWEWVTALLARALQIDPFNQPNVTEAKERTSRLIIEWNGEYRGEEKPIFEDADLAIFSDLPASSLKESLGLFLSESNGYYAIMAFLNRSADLKILLARDLISRATNRPTTFGWGPRFLHSTGQFHKGGQQNGAFLQITGNNLNELAIPGRNFNFHTLLMAQALGDGQALRGRELPFLQIHLKNRANGIEKMIDVLKEMVVSRKN